MREWLSGFLGTQCDLLYLHTGALGWMIKDLKSDLNSIATNGMFVIDNFFNHALMVECKCQYLLPK